MGTAKVGTFLGTAQSFALKVQIWFDSNAMTLQQTANSSFAESCLVIVLSLFFPMPQMLPIKGREPFAVFFL